MLLLVAVLCILASASGRHMPYIIGGSDVDYPGKYPWQGSLNLAIDGIHECRCVLISDEHVLTVAHCVSDLYHKYFMSYYFQFKS